MMLLQKTIFSLFVVLAAVIVPFSVVAGGPANSCTTNADCTATPSTPVCSRVAGNASGTCVNGTQWFQNIISNILNVIVWPVFITISIIMFIWAGILFLTAHGDPGKVLQATKAVIWGCVGIAIGILGYVAVAAIRGVLGL